MADGGRQMACRGDAKLFQRRPFLSSGPLPRPETGSSTTHACGPRPRIRADVHKALRCAPGILFKASTLLLVVLCQLPRFGPRKLARSWSTGWLECGNDFASWVRVRGLIKMRRAIIPSAPVLRVPTSKIMRATATSPRIEWISGNVPWYLAVAAPDRRNNNDVHLIAHRQIDNKHPSSSG
jgi:hypothetical protein